MLSAKQFIIPQVREKATDQAFIQQYQNYPDKAILPISASALKKQFYHIQKIQAALQLNQVNASFTFDNFLIPDQVKQWVQKPDKTLIVVRTYPIAKT